MTGPRQSEERVPDVRERVTNRTRNRYDRIAPVFDLFESPMERMRFGGWREKLRSEIRGPRALEVGVGTGKNLPYYPPAAEVSAIDLSPRMVKQAEARAKALGMRVALREMDVQRLSFPDRFFDTVFATFVFCSVPDPVAGLRELRRVTKPSGRLLLIEHMRPGNPFLGRLFDLLNPLVVRVTGANINRRTLDNIERAGWRIQRVEPLASDIVRWIEALP